MEPIKNLAQIGARFEIYESAFEVASFNENGLRAAAVLGGDTRHYKWGAVRNLLKDGHLTITYVPRQLAMPDEECSRALTSIQIANRNRRKHYVESIIRLEPDRCCSKKVIAELIPAIAHQISDTKPPSASSLAEWVKKWRDAGGNCAALTDKPKPSRAEFRGVSSEVLEIVRNAINTDYLTTQRKPKKAVFAEVMRQVANLNASTSKPLDVPSEYIVNKLINKIDLYERDRKRYGPARANRRHKAAGRAFVASEPLETCMADGQIMDVILIDSPPDGSPPNLLGRPYLTAVIDVRTRCILAAFISLQPFSGGTLLKAMQIAMVASPGRPKGIMQKLIVDNGCDYTDSGFIRFMEDEFVTVEHCKPKDPNKKAIIERWFRTLNDQLIHQLPGTTFSSPADRGDYRSQQFATITLAELQEKVQDWIDNEYHQNRHDSLGRAPIDVWNEETIS